MMNGSKQHWRHLVAAITLAVAPFLSPAGPVAGVARADSLVIPPDSTPFGKTYSQWSAAWWQWALSIPVHSPPFSSHINHPLFDLTGAQCAEGQTGPVWFLGGAFFVNGTPGQTTTKRAQCTVPSSKALYFPLINAECSLLEGPPAGCPGSSVAALRADIKPFIDGATGLVSADVDGVAIPIPIQFREQSPAFSFTLPPDDLLSAIGEGPFRPGTYFPSVDDGYYVMLAPLPAGTHRVHFLGQSTVGPFTLDVTYLLTVK